MRGDSEFSSDVVLVFGMPRSGTTWVGKIFDSHPTTLYKHEPDSWKKMDDVPIVPTPEDFDRYAPEIQRYFGSVVDIRSAKVAAKTPMFSKSYITPIQQSVISIGIPAAKAAETFGLEIPVPGIPRCLPRGSRLVWKSIESVGRLRLICRALPRASAIHLIRHPCGYISSVLRGESRRKFEDNHGTSEDYGILEMLLTSTLARQNALSLKFFRQLAPVERLAWRWVLFNDEAWRASGDTGRSKSVRYEDICADPMGVVKELFSFVGLDWSEQTERFLQASTSQNERGYYSVYKDPQTAANKWREELAWSEVRRIQEVVRNTMPGELYADAW